MTVTATEAAKVLRSKGMKISVRRLVDGIQDGSYPFGRIVSTGGTGRRSVEIFRGDLERFIKEKTNG